MRMSMTCPMPKMDFEMITMGHGSGGLLTQKLLESGVFKLFANDYLDTHHDGAVFSVQGNIAISTDSYVISPIFFPGGNIGELAVNGTVNDLAMCGAIPKYLSLSFIIEEGLMMEDFWEILLGIKKAADAAGVLIVTGDTKVVEKGKGDKIFINTTGIGILHEKAAISSKHLKPGDKIIISGEVASHGIAILSKRKGLEFDSTLESDTRPLNHVIKEMLDHFGTHIHLLHDPTRGGVASVLKETAMQSKKAIFMEEKAIPMNESVEGACEMLGLDPLFVANEGIFIAFVDESISDNLITFLQSKPETKLSSIIGTVENAPTGQVLLKSKIGGTRVLNLLPGELLPRIC